MALLLRGSSASQREWAAALIRSGKPVALPTETVYGLAGRAFDAESLAQIFRIKARPFFDPLIVHVHPDFDLSLVASRITKSEKQLIDNFWPGPLSLLLPRNQKFIPDLCTSGSSDVAVRAPANPIFQDVLLRVGEPLAAPSANLFGRISPVEHGPVIEDLGPKGLEAIVDGGPTQWGLESSIVRVDEENHIVNLLRPGALPVERILEVLGSDWSVKSSLLGNVGRNTAEQVPGQLDSHYAPFKRSLVVFESSLNWNLLESTAQKWFDRDRVRELSKVEITENCLIFDVGFSKEHYLDLPPLDTICLTQVHSDIEAASKLFMKLRELDEREDSYGTLIFSVLPPPSGGGLWPAIRDRLLRASINKGKPL